MVAPVTDPRELILPALAFRLLVIMFKKADACKIGIVLPQLCSFSCHGDISFIFIKEHF